MFFVSISRGLKNILVCHQMKKWQLFVWNMSRQPWKGFFLTKNSFFFYFSEKKIRIFSFHFFLHFSTICWRKGNEKRGPKKTWVSFPLNKFVQRSLFGFDLRRLWSEIWKNSIGQIDFLSPFCTYTLSGVSGTKLSSKPSGLISDQLTERWPNKISVPIYSMLKSNQSD